jgi:predicted mannosyl-3-phosphoglycerate phosphatase (HAD superfamily)
MAADEAREIASLVAAHLQKLGLTKSLAAFLAENGAVRISPLLFTTHCLLVSVRVSVSSQVFSLQITSVKSKELDLETIYKFYTSSQAKYVRISFSDAVRLSISCYCQ